MSTWPRITDLFTADGPADIALLGAPLNAGAVTPGRYDLGPGAIRAALRRFSTYDVETELELSNAIRDAGEVDVAELSCEAAFDPIREATERCTAAHGLTILLGGHNGITRPAAHGLGLPLDQVGLLTLDAHFDLRDTDAGLLNGNPIRALLEDGLPGANIRQIGLAPFANTAAMHRIASEAGIGVYPIGEVKRRGITDVLNEALATLDHLPALMIDFDIDVIDRSQFPGAPGARPGGLPADAFFAAARHLAAHPKVLLVDLTEFDSSLDTTDLSALTGARWVAEILAGFTNKKPLPDFREG